MTSLKVLFYTFYIHVHVLQKVQQHAYAKSESCCVTFSVFFHKTANV